MKVKSENKYSIIMDKVKWCNILYFKNVLDELGIYRK